MGLVAEIAERSLERVEVPAEGALILDEPLLARRVAFEIIVPES